MRNSNDITFFCQMLHFQALLSHCLLKTCKRIFMKDFSQTAREKGWQSHWLALMVVPALGLIQCYSWHSWQKNLRTGHTLHITHQYLQVNRVNLQIHAFTPKPVYGVIKGLQSYYALKKWNIGRLMCFGFII